MGLFRWFARIFVFGRNAFDRGCMLILRLAFKSHGKNSIFDPNVFYSFQNIMAGNDVSIGKGAVFLAANSRIVIGNKVIFGPNVTIIAGDHNTGMIGRFMYDVSEKGRRMIKM